MSLHRVLSRLQREHAEHDEWARRDGHEETARAHAVFARILAEDIAAVEAAIPRQSSDPEMDRAREIDRFARTSDAHADYLVRLRADLARAQAERNRLVAAGLRYQTALAPVDFESGVFAAMGSGPEALPVVVEAYAASIAFAEALGASSSDGSTVVDLAVKAWERSRGASMQPCHIGQWERERADFLKEATAIFTKRGG